MVGDDLRARRREEVSARLASAGHRMTPQRLAILDALLQPGRHPTAEELHADVRRVSPTTSLATVYKAVDTLRALGELRELDFGVGRARFDAMDPTDHPHALCLGCGRIEDVRLEGLRSTLEAARAASAFRLDSERLQFLGRCPDCLAGDAAARK